ncbi:hypothetical protein [Halomonas sp. BM-2019]|uniref:hypothetical protein n=1 Tax=Halomonas sp. BM-2019 TaxID=2811227 RepID=UPI001B3C48B3|nr:MAG: hypothetical protein J5F18_05930 [Halomonas sp. BM-2019]
MKITVDELQEKLSDISVSDEEIAQYLTGGTDAAAPLGPRLRPDPNRVQIDTDMDHMRVEAAFASSALSRIDRWRRQRRFNSMLANAGNNPPPIIYAEGDSWFQFPFLLRDLVNQLSSTHLVWCTSEPGDTLQNMVHDKPEYLRTLNELLVTRGLPVRYFLFSGAGNDVVGQDDSGIAALSRIVRPFDPDKPPQWHVETPALEDVLGRIRRAYIKVLEDIDREFPATAYPDLRIVIHGYDYSPTRSVGGADRNRPFWARDWTGEPLHNKGFPDNAQASRVVRALIDRLNETTATICSAFGPRAIHADLRGSVPQGDWADELHPTSDGFKKAAAKLRALLA